ncbi:response regulator [Nitrospirillum sp. BR 11752]|uniref:response regulator transcription factor n=1 Tax=Nitrospirillum sp. BR 11752 TaxID=3104293 RepID=UPI002EBDAD12|nr:response regulator [Nitrospirillum sp. BR 11752]
MILTGVRILVADDEPFTRSVVETTLRKMGAAVTACGDGRQALDIIAATPHFDIVLLDFMMPWAHGLYVLKQIRMGVTQLPAGVPVGIFTSSNEETTVSLSIALDCDAFLVKPVDRVSLMERLGRLLSRRGRAPQPPERYERVDVGPPNEIMAPAAGALALTPRLVESGYHLDELRPGMVLRAALTTVQGQEVVPAGVTLTEDLLTLLGDLGRVVQLHPAQIA